MYNIIYILYWPLMITVAPSTTRLAPSTTRLAPSTTRLAPVEHVWHQYNTSGTSTTFSDVLSQ